MAASKQVATNREGLPAYQQWQQAMVIEAELEANSDTDFDPATILNSILSAETFEQAVALQTSSLASGKTLTNRPHFIEGFRLLKSDDKFTGQNDRQLGVYAVVDAVFPELGPVAYGCGAPNVLAILWQARQFGKIPGDFQLVSRETRNGELLSLMPLKPGTVRS